MSDVRYVTRRGRRIAVKTLDTGTAPKTKRAPFETQWAKLPRHWAEALRRPPKSASAYELAHVILFEAFKRHYVGGEIVLSSTVTGMSRCAKMRAANKLVELGLIKIVRNGKHALRVTQIPKSKP
jgi:hypothetical protein